MICRCLLRKTESELAFFVAYLTFYSSCPNIFLDLQRSLLPCVFAFQEAASNVSYYLEHLPELPFQMQDSQDFQENLHSKSSAPLIRLRDHTTGREKYFCNQSKQLCNWAAKQGNFHRQLLFLSCNSSRFCFLFLFSFFVFLCHLWREVTEAFW